MELFRPHYKAFEIEELLDIAFFHPLGKAVAVAARAVRLTPVQVTVISMIQGVAGGWLLMWDAWDMWGVVLLVVSGVFDSADGQLARMTGRTSLQGRILDGMVGYFTFTSVFLAITFRFAAEHGGGAAWWIWALTVPAGLSTSVQAILYDSYRSAFVNWVVKGDIGEEKGKAELSSFYASSYKDYENRQRLLTGSHLKLTAAFREKFGSEIPDSEREAYRSQNRYLIRGWNLFGDNLRIMLIALFCWLDAPEGFFWFALIPLNLAVVVMMFLQAHSDRILLRRVS